MVEAAIFDLYYILVELVFGSVWMSYFALVVVFVLYGFIMRMSPLLIAWLVIAFSFVLLGNMFGPLVPVVGALASLGYAGFQAYNWMRRVQ